MKDLRSLAFALVLAGCVSKDPLTPFRSLHSGMSIDQVRLKVGPPDDSAGVSSQTDVYRLDDGSDVALEFNNGSLTAAKHGNEQLLPSGR